MVVIKLLEDFFYGILVIIYLIMMATAFLGYVLPMGQNVVMELGYY
jgi:hypothetical protein